MGCLDDNTILGFVEGLLTADEMARLEAHLDECDACRRLVATLADEPDPTPLSTAESSAPGEGSGFVLQVGEQVDDYRILRPLGRGGMGTVWLARDTRLGRKVALKMVHGAALERPDTKERFLREARLTAQFNHPHIVTLFGVGEFHGVPYLALEYLEGHTLRERLEEERLGRREGLRVGLAIARALEEAHAHGILHRDLKPQNVLLARDGRLRVLDFGLAKPVSLDEDRATLPALAAPEVQDTELTLPPYETGHRVRFGTPAYMAPEQWRGDGVGPASDVWALGVMLHELWAGRRPHPGAAYQELRERAESPDPVPSLRDAGVDLPADLVALVDRCLAKDPEERPTAPEVAQVLQDGLAVRDVPGGRALLPFRGLLPFTERHAGLFYGRDTELAAFLERLREEPVLPILGPSGAGKSSFVLAGVIPRLREQGRWVVLRMRPGRRPFVALASRLERGETAQDPQQGESPGDGRSSPLETTRLADALRDHPTRLALELGRLAEAEQGRVLLVVDQLEELDTHVEDDATRRAFMEALCSAADDPSLPVRVIFTLRDDFLWRLAEGDAAREVLGRVVVLRPPGPEALAEILERTVARVGYRWDDHLLAEMLTEVEDEGAALPLLQFAGQLIWERRDRESRTLPRRAYEAVGGVAGALAHHADGTLAALTASQERRARELFLRMVTPESTRRVVSRSELLDGLGDEASAVLDRLIAERAILVRKGLQGSAEPELELVHESLIHSWTRLRHWLEESREERAFLAEVGQAAALWDQRGRPETEVWQGEALAQALRHAARCARVPGHVTRFLETGRHRAARGARRRRRLLTAGMALLALVALAAVAVSLTLRSKEREAQRQRRHAQRERHEAQRQRTQAQRHQREALRQRSTALLESAQAAWTRGSLIEARAKLRGVLESHDSALARSLWRRLQESPLHWRKRLGAFLYDVTFSPDGRTVAVACMDRTVYLFDRVTGAARALRGHTDQIMAVAFSPDGRHLASSTWAGAVWIWDLRTGKPRALPGHPKGVMCLRYSHDGRLLATSGSDTTVRIWDAASGRQTQLIEGHTAPVRGLAFHPSGKTLATASVDRTIRLWDVASGRQRTRLKGHTAPAWSVAFRPDGRLLVSVGEDRAIRLWDVATGRQRRVLRGHDARVLDVAFSPDGKRLATSSADKTVRLWDVASGRELRRIADFGAPIWGVAFSPDGALVASVGEDRHLRLHRNLPDTRRRTGHLGSIMGLDVHPKGTLLASGGVDRTIRLWDVATGRVQRVLTGHDAQVLSVSFHPEGRVLASASNDRTVRLWDVATGRQTAVLRGHRAGVFDARFSPDGRRLASGGYDRTVRLWNPRSGRQTHLLRGHEGPIHDVAFSPDGRRLASTSADKTVRLWHLASGRQTAVLRGHHSTVRGVSFRPDGRVLASAGVDRRVRLWHVGPGPARLLRTLGPHPGRVYGVRFHPEGRHLGVPCSDGTAWIWNLDRGTHRLLRGHQAEVNNFRFGPRGRLAATVSDDGTVRAWETHTGRPAWRAPLLRAKPLELLTHRGWLSLSPPPAAAHPPRKWRTAVERRARFASEDPVGGLLCLGTADGRLEIWHPATDRRLVSQSAPGLSRVLALPKGCLTLARGVVRLHPRAGKPRVIAQQATSIAATPDGLLVSASQRVLWLTRDGHHRQRYATAAGVTALTRVGAWIVLGFGDGGLELLPTRPGQTRPRFSFEDTPASPVMRLLPGPGRTLVAGFANGEFGLWSLDHGTRIEHGRLHGGVVHLRRAGTRLVAASSLGHHRVLDLRAYVLPHCQLLRQVWTAVPVIWKKGLPRNEPSPPSHPCTSGRPIP